MRILLCLVQLLIGPAVLLAAPNDIVRSADPAAGAYIVVFQPNVSRPDELAVELGNGHGVNALHVYRTAVKGFYFRGSERAAFAISRNPQVKFVAEATKMYVGGSGVDDPAPWQLDRIDQPDLPLSGYFIYKYSGVGVAAYIIDSGINAGQEIAWWRIRESRSFVPGDGRVSDIADHGTAVAALVGGIKLGVAKDVTFINYRVLDASNSFSNSGVVTAAVDAMVTDHNNRPGQLAVANLSLFTYSGTDPVLDIAVRNAVNAGITVVAIAGNITPNSPSTDACTVSPAHLGDPTRWPAGSNPHGWSVITVGATNRSDSMYGGSKSGPCVDVFAPGENVEISLDLGNTWQYRSGTSLAAPLVAGVAALKLEALQVVDSPGVVEASIKDNATANRLSNLGPGSPNLLLYTFNKRTRVCCTY